MKSKLKLKNIFLLDIYTLISIIEIPTLNYRINKKLLGNIDFQIAIKYMILRPFY